MTTPDIDLDADARIARLAEMEAWATPGPWEAVGMCFQRKGDKFSRGSLNMERGIDGAASDAALIAAVRNDLPWLLEQARAVADANEKRRIAVREKWVIAEEHATDMAKLDAAEATVARLQQENADLAAKLHKAEQDAARQAMLASTRLAEKDGEIVGLREALRPFAEEILGEDDDDFPDATPVSLKFGRATVYQPITMGDLRRAAARLADTGRSDADGR